MDLVHYANVTVLLQFRDNGRHALQQNRAAPNPLATWVLPLSFAGYFCQSLQEFTAQGDVKRRNIAYLIGDINKKGIADVEPAV